MPNGSRIGASEPAPDMSTSPGPFLADLSRSPEATGCIQLPLRVGYHPEESLAGFVARLAERNRTEGWSVIPLMKLAGVPGTTLGSIQEAAFPMAGLARMSGVPEEELIAKGFPRLGHRMNRVGSGQLARRYLTTSTRQVCPSCLAEAPVHRRLWHLAFAASCPRHGGRLIRSCPGCGEPLRWCSGTLAACACGTGLARSVSEARPGEGIRGLATICRLLGLEQDAGRWAVPLSPPVLSLPTDGVVDLIVHLGWFALSDDPAPRRLAADGGTLDVALNAGADACAAWPRTFEDVLDVVAARAVGRTGRYGFRHDLGFLAYWVSSVPRTSDLGRLLRTAITDWWSRRGVAPTRAPGFPGPVSRRQPLKGAAAALGIGLANLRDVSDRLELGLDPDAGGSGAPILVEAARVARARARLDDLVGDREAAQILGCGRTLFQGLVECGVLQAADGRHLRLPGSRRWSKAGLRACLERLPTTGDAPAPPEDRMLTAQDAIVLLRRRGHTLETAWNALASGQLGPVHRRPPGDLATCLVHAAAVGDLGLADRAKPPGMTVPEAAVQLGLKQEVVYLLCSRGLLRASGLSGDRRISGADLATFKRDFFVPAHHEKSTGRSRGWLACHLKGCGVTPVSGPGIDGGRQYIFRAAEIEAGRHLFDVPSPFRASAGTSSWSWS
ncbi:TniQ family protein [Roseomonas populi]|uniref:TniQ family protein n=1 Tax=Roseomonas populi TaxID=3121582 RepID=A0ABT1X4T9_9PROT|nr:TniQ family protein [Roseomonas pecuniae]MCR0983130.1 TniQ family protein [Roseomonas pecuniae]